MRHNMDSSTQLQRGQDSEKSSVFAAHKEPEKINEPRAHLRSKKHGGIEFSKPTITRNELTSVLESLIQDNLGVGSIVLNMEKDFARAFEFEKALAVNSHTSAWHLALLSINVRPDQDIILSANSPVAILDAISQVAANPLLVDIARNSFHPDVESIANAVTDNTAVVVISYAHGSFCDYDQLRSKIENRKDLLPATKKKIKIIQDISFIAGAEAQGSFVGGLSDMTVLGLHEEHIMTIGKGALLLTDSKNLFSVAKDLRMHGGTKPYKVRYDYGLTDYQAAMALEQLSLLPNLLERRRKIAMHYLEALGKSRFTTFFSSLGIDTFTEFPVLTDAPLANVQRFFNSLNIETESAIPYSPLHKAIGLSAKRFQNTEKLFQRGIRLPLYPNLTKGNIERITNALRTFY